MAAITITAANVKPSAAATIIKAKLADTVTAGDVLYKNTSGAYVQARANAASTKDAKGIAASGGVTGQWIGLITQDPALEIGGTTAQGQLYGTSDAVAGEILPASEIVADTTVVYVDVWGIGLADNKIKVDFDNKITGDFPATP